jgi:hypothetical protein
VCIDIFMSVSKRKMNVRDSDGTLILALGPVTGGTARTLRFAKKFKKPHLAIDLSKGRKPEVVKGWGQKTSIRILNVAGPRESKAPGIHDRAIEFVMEVFKR